MNATAGTIVEQAQPGTIEAAHNQPPESPQSAPSESGQPTTWETIQLESSRLVERVEQLIHEGNVRRIVVKQGEQTIVEFPLAVGVVGTLLAAPLAALGALTVLLNDCTIEVERYELAAVQPVVPVDVQRPAIENAAGIPSAEQAPGEALSSAPSGEQSGPATSQESHP